MEPGRGYRGAKGLLKEHIGNEYKVPLAYIEKALNWSSLTMERVSTHSASFLQDVVML